MMTAPAAPLPSGPDQLSNAWLTAALRGAGAIGESAVSSHSWKSVERPGAAGVVVRITLEYEGSPDAAAPQTIVAKFASQYEPLRSIFNSYGFYRTEVEFYRYFGSNAGIPVPRCYFADLDTSAGYFALLLEDMRDCRVGDPLQGSLEDVQLAIDHLAPFHAHWWDSPRLREFDWMRHPEVVPVEALAERMRGQLARSLSAVRQRFPSEFPPVLVAVVERLLANYEAVLERQRDASRYTLVHRDFHPLQLFFPTERGGRFGVFDWQTAAAGRGADDLARIVTMGLTIAQREQHERRLIERYHAGVARSGVSGYTLEQCVLDFRAGLTTSLLTNLVAATAIDPDLFKRAQTEFGVNLADALFRPLGAAVEAHDVLSLLPGHPQSS
jgi:aminoglycoside/choline kinase family phosphotransferase